MTSTRTAARPARGRRPAAQRRPCARRRPAARRRQTARGSRARRPAASGRGKARRTRTGRWWPRGRAWWPPLLVATLVLVGVAWDAEKSSVSLVTGQCTLPTSSVVLTNEQAQNAITIAAVAHDRGLPERAVVIALATAQQESRLRNLPYGDRDSLGLFQQRPSQGGARRPRSRTRSTQRAGSSTTWCRHRVGTTAG